MTGKQVMKEQGMATRAGWMFAVLLGACAPSASNDAAVNDVPSVNSEASVPVDAPSTGSPLTLRFAAKVGATAFDCARTYPMLGTGNSTWTPKDFRFYVHDVRLVTATGDVPFAISTAGAFQGSGMALLDFENRAGACTGGTVDTNNVITGTTTATGIQGIKFRVGVPFEMNHRNPSGAAAPMNVSSMWWTWNAGYRFIRIEGNTVGRPMGYNIHLGSTGCSGNAAGPMNPCPNPNILDVTIMNFDPARDQIVADLATLVSMANLETNASMSAPGCMSDVDDMDCQSIFNGLGLPYAGAGGGMQRFFRIEPAAGR